MERPLQSIALMTNHIRQTCLFVALAVGALAGCSDTGSPAPAPCEIDADCGQDIRCLHLHDDTGADSGGYCDVAEMGTSSATPAPCTSNADCGNSVACLHVHDDATSAEIGGYCDVDELVVCTPGGGCDPSR